MSLLCRLGRHRWGPAVHHPEGYRVTCDRPGCDRQQKGLRRFVDWEALCDFSRPKEADRA